jgi:hypothetical protein
MYTITGARLYNNQEFFVSCDINVPVSSKIRARSARAPVARETENAALLPGILDKMMNGGDPAPVFDGNLTEPAGDVDTLDKRQGACGFWSQITRRIGDGNPHQNYFLKQLSVLSNPLLPHWTCLCSKLTCWISKTSTVARHRSVALAKLALDPITSAGLLVLRPGSG